MEKDSLYILAQIAKGINGHKKASYEAHVKLSLNYDLTFLRIGLYKRLRKQIRVLIAAIEAGYYIIGILIMTC